MVHCIAVEIDLADKLRLELDSLEFHDYISFQMEMVEQQVTGKRLAINLKANLAVYIRKALSEFCEELDQVLLDGRL